MNEINKAEIAKLKAFARDDLPASELDVRDWLDTKVVAATDWAPLARASCDAAIRCAA